MPYNKPQNIWEKPWALCVAALFVSFFITKKLYIVWFPLRFIKVFWHEIGHTLTYWLFGHFAIPAVNPIDTGGVAISVSYTPGFAFVVIGAICVGTYSLRKYKYMVPIGVTLAGLYAACAFSPAKEWLIAAAGILAEYVMIGVCLYRCLFCGPPKAGRRAVEKFLYGLLGWHAFVERVGFLFKIKSDEAFYQRYISGSGWQAGITGDLAKIAQDINYRFSANSFDTIVNLFIILAFLPVLFIIFRAIVKSEKIL